MFKRIAYEIDVDRLPQDDEIASTVHLIQDYEREILTLRKRLNPLLPAARDIPDDILVEIFDHSIWMARHYRWDYRWSDGTKPRKSSEGPDWWSVPLVCQRWRDLVMSHPRLWSFISSMDRPEYVRRAIERSGNAGLQLRLFSPGFHSWSHNPAIFQELLELLPRAYMLEYQFKSYPTKEDNRIHTLASSLPQVQTLYLRGDGEYDFCEDIMEADSLAQLLVVASLSRLETLILANTPTYLLNILKHQTITSLEIDNETTAEPHYYPKPLDLGFFVDGLACLPLLRVFRLRVLFLLDERRDPSKLGRVEVHFPHLQELKLDTVTETCLRLLSLISFRPQANVFISSAFVPSSFDGRMGGGPVNLKLTAHIVERLKVLQFGNWSPPYRLTLADKSCVDHVKKVRWTEHTVRLSSQAGHTLHFEVFRSHDEGRDCVIQHLPLQDIETIEFQNSDCWRYWPKSGDITHMDVDSHWTRTIAATSLVFGDTGRSHSFYDLLRSFADLKSPSRDVEGSHPRCLLPQVKSLTLVGDKSSQYIFETLRTTLRKRRADGSPIEELVWRPNEDQEPKFTRNAEATLLETLQDLNVKVTLDLPVLD